MARPSMKKRACREDAIGDEIDWLRSFGWSNQRIAERLGIHPQSIQNRDRVHAQRAEASQ